MSLLISSVANFTSFHCVFIYCVPDLMLAPEDTDIKHRILATQSR